MSDMRWGSMLATSMIEEEQEREHVELEVGMRKQVVVKIGRLWSLSVDLQVES